MLRSLELLHVLWGNPWQESVKCSPCWRGAAKCSYTQLGMVVRLLLKENATRYAGCITTGLHNARAEVGYTSNYDTSAIKQGETGLILHKPAPTSQITASLRMAARCAKFDRADVIAHDVRRGYSRDISRLSTAGVANFMPGKARFEAKAALNHSNKSLDVTRKYIGADDNKKLILNRLDPLAPQSIADAVDTEVIAAESNEAA